MTTGSDQGKAAIRALDLEAAAWTDRGQSGMLESEYADGVSSRRAGEVSVVPAGARHRSRNPGTEPVRLLIVDEG